MLFFPDLETIPSENPLFLERIKAKLSPPANYKKPETIEKWWTESAPDEIESKHRAMALNAWKQEIITIGWSIGEDGDIIVNQRQPGQSEGDLLRVFLSQLDAARVDENGYNHVPTKWVGCNPMFEIYGLAAALARNRIRTFLRPPIDAKPWSANIVDFCTILGGRESTSMDDICIALGIEEKGDFNGSMVYDAWKAGDVDKIADYCGDDIRRAKEIYSIVRPVFGL